MEHSLPYGGLTPEEYEERLAAKLDPKSIRATLQFAGIYQIIHEQIKKSVLDGVHDFYLVGLDENGLAYDDDRYTPQVLNRTSSSGKPLNKFNASLSWLGESRAITQSQADNLDAIYDHRHELTHELAMFVVDVHRSPDIELFEEGLSILTDLNRFWVQIERDTGMFEEFGDIDVNEVYPLSFVVLQQCLHAFSEQFDSGSDSPASE